MRFQRFQKKQWLGLKTNSDYILNGILKWKYYNEPLRYDVASRQQTFDSFIAMTSFYIRRRFPAPVEQITVCRTYIYVCDSHCAAQLNHKCFKFTNEHLQSSFAMIAFSHSGVNRCEMRSKISTRSFVTLAFFFPTSMHIYGSYLDDRWLTRIPVESNRNRSIYDHWSRLNNTVMALNSENCLKCA